ncbi:MAG: OsmC family protein [Bacteroidota bacterium]
MKEHHYTTQLNWTGNEEGKGTFNYTSYTRDHTISVANKYSNILASSDPGFRGDASRYNPEELFLASLSACHMLWYLHLCSVNKVIVDTYEDEARGTMMEQKDGSGQFTKVTLYPKVIVRSEEMRAKAMMLHHEANKMCFIANSCNFKIDHRVTVIVSS